MQQYIYLFQSITCFTRVMSSFAEQSHCKVTGGVCLFCRIISINRSVLSAPVARHIAPYSRLDVILQ